MSEIQTYNDLKLRFERLDSSDVSYFMNIDKGFGTILWLNSKTYYNALNSILKNKGDNEYTAGLKEFEKNVNNVSNVIGGGNIITSVVGYVPVIGNALSLISSFVGAFDVIDAINDSDNAREKLRPVMIYNTPYHLLPVESEGKTFLHPTVKKINIENIEHLKTLRPKCRAVFSSVCKQEHLDYIQKVEIYINALKIYSDSIHAFKTLESLKQFSKTWVNDPFGNNYKEGTVNKKGGLILASLLSLVLFRS